MPNDYWLFICYTFFFPPVRHNYSTVYCMWVLTEIRYRDQWESVVCRIMITSVKEPLTWLATKTLTFHQRFLYLSLWVLQTKCNGSINVTAKGINGTNQQLHYLTFWHVTNAQTDCKNTPKGRIHVTLDAEMLCGLHFLNWDLVDHNKGKIFIVSIVREFITITNWYTSDCKCCTIQILVWNQDSMTYRRFYIL